MTLQETIALFCRENSLLPKNGHVLAAVSGGADSMCMLHLLMELSRREGGGKVGRRSIYKNVGVYFGQRLAVRDKTCVYTVFT